MITLAQTLDRFNRKERFWLLRKAIGVPFQNLCIEFRHDLRDVLQKEVPETAWWAFDYHIDWLIAALRIFPEELTLNVPHDNVSGEIKENQEDFDLVVAFEGNLILIEAKTKYFSNTQLRSKLSRLSALIDRDTRKTVSGIEVSFILSSPPTAFRNLKFDERSQWALRNGKPLHIDLPYHSNPLMVSRSECLPNELGEYVKCKTGSCWSIYKE